MKSKFFETYGIEVKNQEKFINIQTCDQHIFDTIASFLLQRNRMGGVKTKEVTEMVRETESNADLIIDRYLEIYWLVLFFARRDFDSTKDFLEDLTLVYPNVVKDAAILEKRLDVIRSISEKQKINVRGNGVREDGLPLLSRLSTCVVSKPIFEKRFDIDEIDIKEYSPNRIGKISCAVIEIKNSYDQYFTFQLDGFQLEKFINDIISLQIELKSFENE